LIAIGVVLAVAAYLLVFTTPPGPRSLRAFDPDRTAELEVDMWRAYYLKQNRRLFTDLVVMTHEQYRYPWAKAVRASFYLARAAATFGNLRSDYEKVLPDLERAYAIAKAWTGAGFEPAAVARAELAWWVQRRIPGHNSADEVGGLIADENALLYEVSRARVLEASVLRAAAGRLRDEGGDKADWPEVSRLLVRSYRLLRAAVQPEERRLSTLRFVDLRSSLILRGTRFAWAP
jgi:hypothetical protein